jgi:hypothetical protein
MKYQSASSGTARTALWSQSSTSKPLLGLEARRRSFVRLPGLPQTGGFVLTLLFEGVALGEDFQATYERYSRLSATSVTGLTCVGDYRLYGPDSC